MTRNRRENGGLNVLILTRTVSIFCFSQLKMIIFISLYKMDVSVVYTKFYDNNK